MAKKTKKIIRRNTQKQRKLIRIFSDNLGKSGFTKTMYEMMLEAGYSEASAKQQTTILAGLEGRLQPLVNKLNNLREKAISSLNVKGAFKRATFRDLIDSIDKLTKNIQLMTGKPTEILVQAQIIAFVSSIKKLANE